MPSAAAVRESRIDRASGDKVAAEAIASLAVMVRPRYQRGPAKVSLGVVRVSFGVVR